MGDPTSSKSVGWWRKNRKPSATESAAIDACDSRARCSLREALHGSTKQTRRQVQGPRGYAAHADSWMNEVRPKKLIRRRGVNHDRHSKERQFNRRDFRWSIADEQYEHPREQ